LQRHGFTVAATQNGLEALTALADVRPILVISDIQMPVMDGYDLCRRVKGDAKLRDLPIILLTALSEPQDIIRGLECGADNFIVKPYEEDLLLARIRSVLANCALKQTAGDGRGITVEFAGQHYVIDASRRQILNLLLSTYETAVKTNHDLHQAHEDLKAAQARLIEAEKLQSVGRLAAGIAHEVRNPLAIMEMGVAFLESQPSSQDQQVILQEMQEAVRRANTVITGLMDLSPRELGTREANLHESIERALRALNDELVQGGVVVIRDLAGTLPAVRLDEAKIEQVFMNVFTNSLHAMPNGGRLTIKTGIRTLGAEEVQFEAGDRSGARFREGERVIEARVEDTGCGVKPQDLDKVFEPFFSTKPTGKGMGLGLTVARKLIQLHHGTITVANRPKGGVAVTILLKIP
jgi:signal transduction histidine kinase